jgi:iron complex outermembrane receptor protein
MKGIIAIWVILLLATGSIYGQDEDVIELKEVVVTGSRLPLEPKETGRNISVLKSDVIANLPIKSVDELLRYIPGVEAQSRNAFGTQSDIIIRGSTFQQVLVLIDGMRLNDPLTGHFSGYVPISPAEIDRIEILRGPATSMFGADAVGGVVHIITKTFSRQSSKEDAANIDITAGENGLLTTQIGGYIDRDKFEIGLGAISSTSEGHELPSGQMADFKIQTFSASAGYKFNDKWKLLGRAGYDFRDFNAQYFYTRSPFDESRETVSKLWGQLKLRNDQNESVTDIDLAFKRTDDVFVFNPNFPSTNEHTTGYTNFQVNRYQKLNEAFGMAYGIQADQRDIVSTDRGDHNDLHIGAYGIVNYGGQHVNVNGSLRMDYDENYDIEFVPQLNASYVSGKWVLRSALGRTIRAADYTERYISTNISGPLTPGRNLGNPDLIAESAWSFEAGVDYFPTNGLKIISTIFLRKSSNLIDFVIANETEITNNENLEAGEDYFWAKNIADVTTGGFELEGWYQKRLNHHSNLNFSVGYTFLNTNNSSGDVSKYISNHARHLLSSNAVLISGKWEVSINGLYKVRDDDSAEAIGSILKPNYTVWNARIGFLLIPSISVNLEVHNIFNEQYSDILGAKMPDRWVMGGISWNLQNPAK